MKKKAPEPANELVTTAQGTDAAKSHSRTNGGAAGELRTNNEVSPESGEEAARIERALQTVKDADEWTREHADAWDYMCRACIAEARAGRQMSMQWAAELIRRRDFASFKRYGAGINNRLRPVLARRLIREYPECARFIEIRKSIFDELEVVC